jgi:hypothetical protein
VVASHQLGGALRERLAVRRREVRGFRQRVDPFQPDRLDKVTEWGVFVVWARLMLKEAKEVVEREQAVE